MTHAGSKARYFHLCSAELWLTQSGHDFPCIASQPSPKKRQDLLLIRGGALFDVLKSRTQRFNSSSALEGNIDQVGWLSN